MILWRNGLVHNLTNFYAHSDYPDLEHRLQSYKNDFYNDHCHLDIDGLINRFKNKKVPTFKETTSMIKASIKYLYLLDKNLINNLDYGTYINDCVCDYIKSMNETKKTEYFKYRIDRRISFLSSALCQNYAFESNNTNPLIQTKLNELANENESYFS